MPRSTSTQPPTTDEDTGTGAALLDVLSHVVHELRGPLTVITGYAALLGGGSEPSRAELSEFVDAIARNARMIDRRLEVLADTEEVLRGSLALAPEVCDLGALVEDAVAHIAVEQGSDRVRVHADRSVVVSADRRRLARAVGQLVDNALRSSPDDETVDVAVTATGAAAAVRVSDRGAGVPEESRPLLFQRFARVGPGANGVEAGLFLAHSIVQAHGGTLRFDPTPGEGATFIIEMPVATGTADDLRREQPSPPVVRRGWNARTGPATVLHVEDDRATAELVEHVLTAELDVSVVLAAHAPDVPELVDRLRPALVLLDLRVGDHDGEEVLRQLRSHPSTEAVPVAVVSGGLTDHRTSELLRRGADAVLAKPFHPDQLCETVRVLLAAPQDAVGRWSASLETTTHDDPLDPRYLEALEALNHDSEGDEGVAGLVHTMVADALALMDSLQVAAEAGDTAEAARRAHSLTGGIGNLGAHVVVRRCSELETVALAGDAAAVSCLVGLVSAAVFEASTALDQRFPRPTSATGGTEALDPC